jgi:CBS domain-containing protein
MKVSEIMSTNVECFPPEAGIKELAIKMKTLDVGFIPICENDRLAGTVTDRDLVLRGIAEGRDINSTRARDVMTNDIFWCFEDEDVKAVAKKMREREVRRLLILNRDKRLVGVVSLGDISQVEEKASGQTLHNITEAA